MITKHINIFLITIIIILIRIYQLILSPIFKNNCRYMPTCSEYSITALKEYGTVKGVYLSVKRILRCHPFGGYGCDPVPKKNNTEI